jgi:YHS domain-containing protein
VEELVKDPVCGVHTARSSAIVGRYRGSTAYFCSEECAAKADAGAA